MSRGGFECPTAGCEQRPVERLSSYLTRARLYRWGTRAMSRRDGTITQSDSFGNGHVALGDMRRERACAPVENAKPVVSW
jgi:hypothetical protein